MSEACLGAGVGLGPAMGLGLGAAAALAVPMVSPYASQIYAVTPAHIGPVTSKPGMYSFVKDHILIVKHNILGIYDNVPILLLTLYIVANFNGILYIGMLLFCYILLYFFIENCR